MKNTIAGALLIGALALSPGFGMAEESEAAIEKLIMDSANSPADHAALAKYYRGKAADARAEASRHKAMGSAYGGGKLVQKEQMMAHCKKLSEENTAMAAEYDSMAKVHDEDAKK